MRVEALLGREDLEEVLLLLHSDSTRWEEMVSASLPGSSTRTAASIAS